MMKWRPWPPLISKKFEVKLLVSRLENLVASSAVGGGGVAVEIRWKGPPKIAAFRKTVKRNCTKEEEVKDGADGAVLVEWDEEFEGLCNLSGYKDNVFHPWEIAFTVLNVRPSLFLFCSCNYHIQCLALCINFLKMLLFT